jgi:hypothetical protein
MCEGGWCKTTEVNEVQTNSWALPGASPFWIASCQALHPGPTVRSTRCLVYEALCMVESLGTAYEVPQNR